MMSEYYDKNEALYSHLVEQYGHQNVEKFLHRADNIISGYLAPERPTLTVAVSGAAGQIAYSLLFRIASGGMFGNKTAVNLRLLDLPFAETKLQGVKMELEDCAFPLVNSVTTHTTPEKGFEGADWVLLVGGTPRTKGMERKDLLLQNAEVFRSQGRALNSVANGANTRVYVVGNPANTNAWIASENAPSIPKENFAAMTRLDYNRGISLLGEKLKVNVNDISKFVIWGNHSATQFPDINHASFNGKLVSESVDKKWLTETFIPTVQQRGAAVIAARGASSAASAANAIVDGVRDWYYGTKSSWASVAVPSKGEYGITPGLYYSYPVVYENLKYAVVEQLPIDEFAAERMELTHKELLQELEVVSSLKN
jgi:malate dehydrogenase